MLHRLLKYDLKAIYRYTIIFYLIALVCAVIGRLFHNYGDNLLLQIIHKVFAGAATGLCFGMLISNVTRIWEYTKRNFYGDESYLTHTLPVPRRILYLSKFLTTIITIFTSFLVIAVILFINYASPEVFEMIDSLIYSCGSSAEFIKFASLIIAVAFLEVIFICQAGLTGIILGHRASNHKTLLTFAWSFGIFILASILTVILFKFWTIFDPEIARELNQNYHTNSAAFKLLVGAIVVYCTYIAATTITAKKSLERGVDVD